MEWWQIVLLVIGILAVVLVGLFFLSKRLQGKVDNQQTMIDQNNT